MIVSTTKSLTVSLLKGGGLVVSIEGGPDRAFSSGDEMLDWIRPVVKGWAPDGDGSTES